MMPFQKGEGNPRWRTKFPSIEERFWSKVKKSDSCWLWTAGMDKDGYAMFKFSNRGQRAARFIYQVTYLQGKPIADGMMVCHHCDNPACVRPEHLFLGTARDNVLDMVQKGRMKIRYGELWHSTKLSNKHVAEIRANVQGLKGYELAELYGVSQGHISMIRSGKHRPKG